MPKSFTAHLSHSVAHLELEAHTGRASWTPNTDVYETADRLIVKMELAGLDKNALAITVHDRMLVVSGKREDICRPRQCRCTFRQVEIDYGLFERRIVILHAVNVARARARLHNGFLRVELPKASHARRQATLSILIEE